MQFLTYIQLSYPPILGAHHQKRPLCERTERDALAILTVNRFGFFLKYWYFSLNVFLSLSICHNLEYLSIIRFYM